MFRRKAYDRLLEWKRLSNGSSAALVEGARRVGKTTLVQEFARNEYSDFIYIDFSLAPKDALDLFRNERDDVDTFLRMLQLNYGKRLKPRDAVIIFDEVQRFPIAREYIKHLVADGRFDYIETGSLVSLRRNVADIVIPSEEDRIQLDPLDFEEYLWASDLEIYADEIRNAREALKPLPDAIHRKAMRLFNEYMLVGGMPQAVAAFVEDKTFDRCDRIKRRTLDLYLEDIAKFGGSEARRARAVFQAIPGQLSASSKRFKFSALGKGERYGTYEPALDWLTDAHIANICIDCADPSVGMRLTGNPASCKCYMADTGLLVSLAFSEGPESGRVYRDLEFGKVSVNKGMLVENVVAQQLHAMGYELFYHAWNEPPVEPGGRKRPREIDFLISKGYSDAGGKLRISPIEVKSTKNYSTVSLDDFARRWGKRVGEQVVLHPKQLSSQGHRAYLPLYMSFCI